MRRFRPLKLTLFVLSAATLVALVYLATRNHRAGGNDGDDDEEPLLLPDYSFFEQRTTTTISKATAGQQPDSSMRVSSYPVKREEREEEEKRRGKKQRYREVAIAAAPMLVENAVSFKRTGRNLQHRLVHLDLKGAPPKLDYLKSLLPKLKSAGATGLLIEYEDMFPYEGELSVGKAGNAYGKEELKAFLEEVKNRDLEAIPLIQTFGHMEWVLKLEEFRNLREVDSYPDSLCPSRDKSFSIIKQMVDQVIDFHSEVAQLKWIHIGCDEVYHINKCPACTSRNLTSKQLFVRHVSRVARHIRGLHPRVTPLVWDDMLRSFLPDELASSGLGALVEPVVWSYGSTGPAALVPHRVWYAYVRCFAGVWIASAFKGASGSTRLVPSLRKNYANNAGWMGFATSYRPSGSRFDYAFRGIVLTGWSRYHHFAVLCEILPVAVPSLLLNLMLVDAYLAKASSKNRSANDGKSFRRELEKALFGDWLRALGCRGRNVLRTSASGRFADLLDSVERKLSPAASCSSYSAARLYSAVVELSALEATARDLRARVSFLDDGLLEYNRRHRTVVNFQNAELVEGARRLGERVAGARPRLVGELARFYDEHAVRELVEQRVEPLRRVADDVLNATREAEKYAAWKRRPFM